MFTVSLCPRVSRREKERKRKREKERERERDSLVVTRSDIK